MFGEKMREEMELATPCVVLQTSNGQQQKSVKINERVMKNSQSIEGLFFDST
jgi:hypothetical protein